MVYFLMTGTQIISQSSNYMGQVLVLGSVSTNLDRVGSNEIGRNKEISIVDFKYIVNKSSDQYSLTASELHQGATEVPELRFHHLH